MGSAFRIDRREDGGTCRLAIGGEITEEARFDAMAPIQGRLVVDLGEVSRINSCGVREWIHFIKGIPEGTEVSFERCPPVFVAQANMIANFLGRGRILTFVAPYFCEKCQRSVDFLLDAARDFPDATARAPRKTCDSCGGPLVFDEVEENYLGFIPLGPARPRA